MDRGDTGFIMHESFKDLRARRAEQEAYRKALEAQIMEKKRLQEQDRERERREFEGRNSINYHLNEAHNDSNTCKIPPPNTHRGSQNITTGAPVASPEVSQTKISLPNHTLPPLPDTSPRSGNLKNQALYQRPNSKGGYSKINEMDSFNEPHPAAVAECMEANSLMSPDQTIISTGMPTDIPPEYMKYIQQVLPGFNLQQTHLSPKMGETRAESASLERNPKVNSNSSGNRSSSEYVGNSKEQAFACGSSTESSSGEDIAQKLVQAALPKAHVSQTSDQMIAGVKISRSLYKADLQKQIEERKKREEEHRQKAQEEEERIQEKIRIEQERMQKEYEDELRKQKEKEKEAERKRLAVLKKQIEVKEKQGTVKSKVRKNTPPESDHEGTKMNSIGSSDDGSQKIADSSSSAETIESIGEFFDTTMNPPGTKLYKPKYVNPDDRIIPTMARMLKEKVKQEKIEKSISDESCVTELTKEKQRSSRTSMETARVESTIYNPNQIEEAFHMEPSMFAPGPGITREMAIRSAPSPPTDLTGLEFLSSLRSYLETEKSKMTQRIQARASRSTEKF